MPMNDVQRSLLERRLLSERARALALLNTIVRARAAGTEQELAGDLTSTPFHPADRGTDTIDEELDMANATRASRDLAEIDAALERLYESPETFGVCQESGRQIPFERLNLIPWARTCD